LLTGVRGRRIPRTSTVGGGGYSDYKGYEDEVQALQDQARAMERISEDLRELKETVNQQPNGQAN
jgi:hypothetical protein